MSSTTISKGSALTPVISSSSIGSSLTIPSGVTLTLSPGAVLKMRSSQLNVEGQLVSQGTSADRIWITSYRDDSVGGDSNGDGVISAPAMGNYTGIAVSGTATMKNCSIRYASTAIANQPSGNTNISDSRIQDCNAGITNGATSPVVIAHNNWWGHDSGPAPVGTGVSVAYHTEYDSWGRPYTMYDVDFDPWVGKNYAWAPNFGRVGWGGYAADPVNVVIGNYTYDTKDVSIPGYGLPLEIVRSYNSQSTADSPFGFGWAFSYGSKLDIDEANDWVLVAREDGRSHRYTKNADSSYTPPPGVFDKLSKRPDATYYLTTKDRTVFDFDVSGVLLSITDRNGNATTLTYTNGKITTVTGPDGRQLVLTVNAAGRIASVKDPLLRTWSYAYDASGNLTTVTDSQGGVTRYTYDGEHRMLTHVDANRHTVMTNTYNAEGRVTEQLDAAGERWVYAYDVANKKTYVTDPLGKATTYEYDAQKRIIKETDPLGGAVATTYDAQNNKTSVSDQLGRKTMYSYDSRGNQLSTTNAANKVATTTYDVDNNPVASTDFIGRLRSFSYDAKGNLTREIDPLGYYAAHTYDARGQRLTSKDKRGFITTFAYDPHGYPAQTFFADGTSMTSSYDVGGRLLATTDALGKTTSYVYDNLDRVTRVTDPMGHQATSAYDAVGNVLTATDAGGETSTYAYDERNDLVTTTDAAGGVTTAVYDANRRKTSVTDANGHTTTYTFDAAGRLTRVTDPLGRYSQTVYDVAGNVTSSTDAKGQTTRNYYDVLNRLVRVDKPGGTTTDVQWAYDANGNKVSMTDALGLTSYLYDEVGRLTTVVEPDGETTGYAYDAQGRRTAITYPDGRSAGYEYDDMGRLVRAVDPAGSATTYSYRDDGLLDTTSLPNGVTTVNTYDAAGRLTGIRHARGSTELLNLTYALDAEGNRIAVTDSLRGATLYEYDALDRLTHEHGASAVVSYTYDATGNRTAKIDGATTAYSYNAADQMLSAGAASFAYDANGSRTSKSLTSDSITYGWTMDNLLASVTTSQTTVAYTYDGEGRRVALSEGGVTTDFTLDVAGGMETVLAEGSADTAASYFYAAGLVSRETSQGVTYYLADAIGSTRLLVNASGVVTGEVAYDAFGAQVASSGADARFAYAGQSDEVVGLQFMRARFYEPETGRFVSVDPVPGQLAAPQTMNPYVYCVNNPVMMTDPEGEWFHIAAGAAVGGLTELFMDLAEGDGLDHHWEEYAGAVVGGGVTAAIANPVAGALAGAAVSSGASILGDGFRGERMDLPYWGQKASDFAIGVIPSPDPIDKGVMQFLNNMAWESNRSTTGGANRVGVSGRYAVPRLALNGRTSLAQISSLGASATYQAIAPPTFQPYTYGRLYSPQFAK